MKSKRNLSRRIVDFISSEEGGITAENVITVGGVTFALLVGQAGAAYFAVYGHNNYVVHTNFIEYVR